MKQKQPTKNINRNQPQQQFSSPLDAIIGFLKNFDELDTAKTLLNTMGKYSSHLQQFDELARLYNDIKAYEESLVYANKVLQMVTNRDQIIATRFNLAKLYNHTNKPKEALNQLNIIQKLHDEYKYPKDFNLKLEQMFSYYLLGDFNKSESILNEIVASKNVPEEVMNRCRFNLGTYMMKNGKYSEGLDTFIKVGHIIGIWKEHVLPFPAYKGTFIKDTLKGVIVIVGEGGIGDELINYRFINRIRKYFPSNYKLIWQTNHKTLKPILARLHPEIPVISNMDELNSLMNTSDMYYGKIDSIEYLLSMKLPMLLGVDYSNLDDLYGGAYITPSQEYLDKWKPFFDNLKATGKTKFVGLRWSGNPRYEQDLHRSLSLDLYMDNLKFNDTVQLISLQKDENSDQVNDYSSVINLSDKLETFEDLLAVIYYLDLVISSCTSVAHATGSMGKNLIVLPPIATYYTWLGKDSENVNWYNPNTTDIIGQQEWRNWIPSLETVNTTLNVKYPDLV